MRAEACGKPTSVKQDFRWFLMQRLPLRARARFRHVTKPLGQAAVGALTSGILRTARYFDPIKTANLFGRIARSIGPMRISGEIACRDRGHSRRRLGQSRSCRCRIRASRSYLGTRSRAARGWPHRNRETLVRIIHATAARRQTSADLCRPSRQLGTSRAGCRRARAGRRNPVSPAQHRVGRSHHPGYAHRKDGHADSGWS